MINNHYLPKKVAIIISDVRREYFPTEVQYFTEKEAENDAKHISSYLDRLGIKTTIVKGDMRIFEKLKTLNPDIAINLVDSVKGVEFLASSIPGVLEILEIPYTGTGILGQSLNYNKFLTKKLLEQNGIPTPEFQLFNTYKDPVSSRLRYPLISKLNEIHGGVEITKDAISETEKHLRDRIQYLISTYNQPVLVEEFVVGREIDAVVLEGSTKKVYLGECLIKKKLSKYEYKYFEIQWSDDYMNDIQFQKCTDPILKEYVKKAFLMTDMSDYGRFDVRIDNSGRYYFIDVNTNPQFGPMETESPVMRILDLYGVTFYEAIKRIFKNTLKEEGNGKNYKK